MLTTTIALLLTGEALPLLAVSVTVKLPLSLQVRLGLSALLFEKLHAAELTVQATELDASLMPALLRAIVAPSRPV